MTARDDAIEAMKAGPHKSMIYTLDDDYFGDRLDAIPDDVLVRLAVERGALAVVKAEFQSIDPWIPRDANGYVTLYRAVTS